ncbi:MAG: hypothetical protein ABIR73_16605 [Usitatibacter sp.]
MPPVIMAPIPLTVIGVMPGHALLGAQFTATSMIGMIALAALSATTYVRERTDHHPRKRGGSP